MAQEQPLIYLDHAATSWPKPQAVVDAVMQTLQQGAANPGRGSHRMAVQSGRVLFEARKNLAKLLRIANPNDIALTANTTVGLNLAIKGMLKPGDHVIATAVEHNSVRRPLEYLKSSIGITVTYVETDRFGELDVARIREEIRPETALVAAAHSSNLLGSILPIADIGEITRRNGIPLLVDAAQSAGILDIDVEEMGIDLLAFPGHKALLGPQGTGGVYIHPRLDPVPLLHGGTGSQSESAEQPTVRPDRYEAGTPNTPGMAGLAAGVRHVLELTPKAVHARETELIARIRDGLASVAGITLLGPQEGRPRTGICAFTMAGVEASELSFILDQHYGIAVRAGYHCTPLAHWSAGTAETGAVRASVGASTTDQEAEALVLAIREIRTHYPI
ncbi:aminotransferase class V-fold PLP-dependent enzyme [Paenibacillus pasadenensis]|uniref:aminotransferase class V-fold PLP-dependent enzyme n=1 Tax=Paenibacillus pasadenensis TaxID=217090 RepID=UPI00203D0206|nr:aminotransferase class V-fold PLP-dependent enzyme [Paenibacillus pasadenensis]MCM3747945.1 aminotransferase class V-fold PLP-dependent enzyme [Paenibacillus pasadenensis]